LTEDFGYGDCRDWCNDYLIEGEHACQRCYEEEQMAMEQEEEDYFGEGIQ